jgi:hypothetical protein
MSAAPATGIYEAMLRVMDEVGAIGKTKKSPDLKYQYRGVDDVLAELQPLFIKHGVLVVPRVVDREREAVQSQRGTPMTSVRLVVEHTFFAKDGSSVVATTIGEALDTSDKASNKAMTAALKYALTESFSIPTYEVDRDTEENNHTPAPAQQSQPAKPPSADQMAKEKAWLLAAFETSTTEADLLKLWPRVQAFKEGTPDRAQLQERFVARRRVLNPALAPKPAPAEDVPF